MFVKYNPNPLGHDTGDCVVRAITAITGKSWDEAYDGVVLAGKMLAKMPTTNEVWEYYLRDLGFCRVDLPDRCPDCYTIADFAADHSRGRYLLGTGDHAVAVIDGCYMDNWDSGSRVPKYYYYKPGGQDNGIYSESKLLRQLSGRL